MFDVLTYEKGASLLRMLEQYLGTETLPRRRAALPRRPPLRATPRPPTCGTPSSKRPSGRADPRPSWTPGSAREAIPFVTARARDPRSCSPKRPSPTCPSRTGPTGSEPSAIGSNWLVPGRPRAAPRRRPPGGGRHTSRAAGHQPMHVPAGNGVLVVNAGGSGVYRLRYDDALLADILASFDRLAPLERFKLVADTWACALAGRRRSSSSSPSSATSRTRRTRASGRWSQVRSGCWTSPSPTPTVRSSSPSCGRCSAPNSSAWAGTEPVLTTTRPASGAAVLIAALGILGADPAVRAESNDRFAAMRGWRGARSRHRLGRPARRRDRCRARRVRQARRPFPLSRQPPGGAALPRLARLRRATPAWLQGPARCALARSGPRTPPTSYASSS